MLYEELNYLSAAMKNAFAPLADIALSPKSVENALNNLKALSEELLGTISPDRSAEALATITAQLSELIKPMLPNIDSFNLLLDSFDFLEKLNFQSDYVELTEDDCDSINALLEKSGSTDTLTPISKGKIPYIKLIKILISIIVSLVPILQNAYYQKINSIESQKAYVEERQLKEEEIQLLKEQIHLQEQQLQLITDYTESLEDTLNELIDCVKLQEPSQEIQESDSVILENPKLCDLDLESLDKDQDHSDTTADEPDNS